MDGAAVPSPATAYSYLRLSSKRQANRGDRARYRDGFRRQIAMRDEYLALNPHLTLDTRLVLHDIGVSGFTGANVARGGQGKLAAFLAEVEAGRIATGSYLLVESLDRMSRQQVSRAQAVLLAMVNAGIVVVSLTDGQVYRQGAHPTQFIISIMSLTRAHEESVVKSKRLRDLWEEKRRKVGAIKVSGRCPAWLTLKDGAFVEDEDRVALIHEVFGYLADGWGRDRIARTLNTKGEKPWGHGHAWHGGTVQKLTDNRALIGEFQPHRLVYEERKGIMVPRRVPAGEPVQDYFPRVVPEALWARARAVANKRRLGRAPNAGGRQGTVLSNLFGMVATCEVCGARMNYRDRGPRSFPVLRCSRERAGACDNPCRVPYHDNENAILSWLVTLEVSEGAPGERARLEDALRMAGARRDELQAQGEAIVSQIGAGSRFAKAPLERIEEAVRVVEAEMADLTAKLSVLRRDDGGDERRMAVARLVELAQEEAPAGEVYAVRARLKRIIEETFTAMRCGRDGTVTITTIDGATHVFRDGYWWYEPDATWVPWAGAFFGRGYRATRTELARRRTWLAEAAQRSGRDGGDEARIPVTAGSEA